MDSEAMLPQQLARERLETELLLGVDFIPLARGRNAAPDDTLPAHTSSQALEKLSLKVAHDFPLCETLAGATQPVFGEGNPEADLMFVGEAPGGEEDRTGRPFVGPAGQKLDQVIAALGLSREEIYIANILKARPPGNRAPTLEEVEASAPYLVDQIRIIQPKVIVSLGGAATKYLLQTNDGITRLRGHWSAFENGELRIPVMPTFHPAYVLRNYTREIRGQVWSDMQKVMEFLGLQTP